MSKLIASVEEIIGENELHVVHFKHLNHTLAMMSLELPNIKIGDKVELGVKSSNVGIGKNMQGDFSFSNILNSKIVKLEIGDVLCLATLEVSTDTYIESLITANSAKKLDLKIGDEVTAFFKASEISIQKVLKSS
ncbi:MAG: molybdopterin-binding protein [Campylobacteraceae bacterium]